MATSTNTPKQIPARRASADKKTRPSLDNLHKTSAPKTGSGVRPTGPPTPGLKGPGVSLVNGLEKQDMTPDDLPMFTFSARTCLALLPLLSNDQIDTEIKHLNALDTSSDELLKSRYKRPSHEHKRDFLYKELARSLCLEVDTIVSNFNDLLVNVSRSVTDASRSMEHLREVSSTPSATQSEDTEETRAPQPAAGNPLTILPPPVRLLSDISFSDINYEDVMSISFTDKLPGGRQTAYFGSVPYSYGNMTHPPAEYPDLQFFGTIFEQVRSIVPDFTPASYTCLVNHYPDGKATVPMHHDNENSIIPGTDIITVSFGATRTVRFNNVEGAQQDLNIKLEHGSVHIMSRASQSVWRHGIIFEPGVTSSRTSLTFRRLVDPSISPSPEQQQEDKSAVPPIAPPGSRPSDDIRPKRILLLTDSIHSDLPEYLLEQVPNHICVKRKLYKLSDIDGWAPQFAHADIVVVSCGINDLSRYGFTAQTLADVMASRFKLYSKHYHGTKFIFNTVLRSRDYEWLNREIMEFNKLMFFMCRDTRNLFFFDSDSLVEQSGLTDRQIFVGGTGRHDRMQDNKSNNGVHVTLQVRKMVTRELVNAVGYIAGSRVARFRSCEWLRCVTTRSPWPG